ncbi:thiamine-binding protein [Nocardia sp. NPDC056611]|uniref:Thiamine-binding protein n=1 Tax=Nocardia tengchongensis TaxID=2055889 RepID=A0ABX8CW70_9NOCA|nr:thiamine-binding protein [Nocardia tengchongensis]QVI23862.1 thiamine-binding protein [Nocardia tengchongensis]
MRLRAEFTTEPFHGEGEAPPHALAALELAESAGLECDFGPLGTSVAGSDERLLPVLGEIMVTAFAHGATRVTMQVEQDD